MLDHRGNYHVRLLIGYSNKMLLNAMPLPAELCQTLADVGRDYNVISHLLFSNNSKMITAERAKKLTDAVMVPAGLSDIAIFNDGIFRVDTGVGVKRIDPINPLTYTQKPNVFKRKTETYRELAAYFSSEKQKCTTRQMVVIENDPEHPSNIPQKLDILIVQPDEGGFEKMRMVFKSRSTLFPSFIKN